MELNRDNKGALFFELYQVVADHLWSLNSLYNTGELGPDQPTAIYIYSLNTSTGCSYTVYPV